MTTGSAPSLFASDNASGAHPEVIEALARANRGHTNAYGDDPWTAAALERFRDVFGSAVEVRFTYGGTGGNVVGLQCMLTRPWQSVICADSAHITTDECGAVERICGAKLVAVANADGKITPDQVRDQIVGVGDMHHTQPRVLSLTQSTEHGTLYTLDELAALVGVARANDLLVHVDGARIANAVAALGGDPRAAVTDLGIDVLTFGGTKNGMIYGEAVVFFDTELARYADYVRKQAGQLPSKMRFVAAQFQALLTDDLWLRSAGHANAMAVLLADRVAGISGVDVQRPPAVNAVFVRLPAASIVPLKERSFFWTWDHTDNVVRWMTSFDTTPQAIDDFVGLVAEEVGRTSRPANGASA